MSLRARLTLQNMLIVGVILLLFGTALYLAIQYALTAQTNNSLAMASDAIRQELRFDQRGTLGMVDTPKLNQYPDIYFQIWGRDGQLKFYSSNLGSYKQPLDGLIYAIPNFLE